MFKNDNQYDFAGIPSSTDSNGDHLRLINESYVNFGKNMDRCFGGLSLLTILLAFLGWMNGLVDIRSVCLFGIFLITNLVMTYAGGKVKSIGPFRLELFRIFFVNGIFCPLIYIYVKGPFSPWWPGYIMFTIGSALTLGMTRTPKKWIYLSFAFWIFNLSFAAYILRDQVSIYQFVLQAGTTLMIGFIFIQLTQTFSESVFREYQAAKDLRKTVETLKNTQMQLVQSEKFSALGQMAAGLAHEINNPLAVINLNAELIQHLLQSKTLDSDRIFSSATTITNTTHRICGIIQGLKSFSREGSNDPYVSESIQNIFSELSALTSQRFYSSQIELDFFLPQSNCYLDCRPGQILQVLLNLMNNSFDSVLNQTEKWVTIHVDDLDSNVQIRIQNSGPIIPDQIKENIFQPFFTTKPIGQGTGLGLSISKGIIEDHKGTIDLESNAPFVTFRIQLPKKHSFI